MLSDHNLLTIGALSRATGVPIETIRTWERRYGAPGAERTESGHRRYSLATVEHLLLVTQAMQRGHPPSIVLRMDVSALRALLDSTPSTSSAATAAAGEALAGAERTHGLEPWFERVERFEGRAFERELRTAWAELGGLAFVELRAAPFLLELGSRWASGRLSVGHEHFASERLREFLVQQWRPLSDAATGGSFVCATLAGETHVLGLHLAALTLAIHNARLVFLGANSPARDVAETARQHAAEAVVLSASAAADPARLEGELRELRAALPGSIPILAGGAGFSGAEPAIRVLRDFSELSRWATENRRS
jgi:MerR family transcriptional regulator, light-induced transcriptional regulator